MNTPDREQALGGWQTMPRHATNRMMDEGVAALHAAARNSDGIPGHIALRAAYDAMRKAAPAPDTVSTNEVRDE